MRRYVQQMLYLLAVLGALQWHSFGMQCSLGIGSMVWGQATARAPTLQPPPNSSTARKVNNSAWQDPTHHIRPHKGMRTEADGRHVSTLMWVLYTAAGKPVGVCQSRDAQIETYFNSRVTAKLDEVQQQYTLNSIQVEKLKLAADLDVARVSRMAQQLDQQLGMVEIGQHPQQTNQLFHAVALACDQQLLAADSLFARVLETQLQNTHSVDDGSEPGGP